MAERPPRPDDFAGARVAILGASGFIGRWVARALAARGATTHLGVRDPRAARDLVAELDGAAVHRVDVTDRASVAAFFAAARPQVTFNLAGYGVDTAERDERVATAVNADAVELIAAAQREVRDPGWVGTELVHVGSALEYGAAPGDLHEETPPEPTTVYGRTKLAGTRALGDFARGTGLRAITARLFTVYGAGEHEGRLLPSIIAAARTRSELPLTAGRQRRDFAYVEEIAEGLLRLACSAAPPGEVVNLASGTLTPVREFVERAARVVGLDTDRLRFGALPTRNEEMSHEPVRVRRLEHLTGWVPSSSIEEGVRRTLAHLPPAPPAPAVEGREKR